MTGGKFQRHVEEARADAPLDNSKAQSTQRLQVGLFGLGSMVLLIGLATVIGNQADITQERSVPEAAPTTEPTEVASQSDPLADAGIVPDIPAEPELDETPSVVADLPLEDTAPEGIAPEEGASLGDGNLQK